jgi:hypothetical protein
LICLCYFLLEAIHKPCHNNLENNKNILSFGVYTVCNLMFLILIFVGDGMLNKEKDTYIGWPLVVLVTILILYNYYKSLVEVSQSIKKMCKKKKKSLQENEKAKDDETVGTVGDGSVIHKTRGQKMRDIKKKSKANIGKKKLKNIRLNKKKKGKNNIVNKNDRNSVNPNDQSEVIDLNDSAFTGMDSDLAGSKVSTVNSTIRKKKRGTRNKLRKVM